MLGTPYLYRLGAGVYKGGMPDPFGGPSEPELVHEAPGYLAVYKPPRMHSAPGAEGGDLCAWVFERYPEAALVRAPEGSRASRRGGREGGLLHRLDYETSGLVLFARDDRSFASLLSQQEEGRFLKEYLARSFPGGAGADSGGGPDAPAGSRPARGSPLGIDAEAWARGRASRDAPGLAALVDAARASGAEPRVECAFRSYGPGAAAVACLGSAPGPAAGPGPRAAVAYRADLLGAAAAGGAVELRLGLARGFRHQLRAQMAWIGLPMDGDPLYGGRPAGRLFLLASRIAFDDPATGAPLVVGPGGPESAGVASPGSGAMGAFASLLSGGNSVRLGLHG
jgi:23S rRNA pseudouridine1911/1915/1917 synthase